MKTLNQDELSIINGGTCIVLMPIGMGTFDERGRTIITFNPPNWA